VLRLLVVLPLLLAATDADRVLEEARAHLEEDQLEELVFALHDKTFEPAAQKKAAALLARAGRRSLEHDDLIFALQFAQMALRHQPKHPEALEVGARACLGQQQFEPAESYADTWLEVTRNGARARVLRAEIALQQGEWGRALALVEGKDTAGLSASEKQQLKDIRATALAETRSRQAAFSELKTLEARLERAQQPTAKKPAGKAGKAVAQGRSGIVLYSTSWCGPCRQAKEYLTRKKVKFVEKDIEKDPAAAEELARKAAAAGVRPRGVPVIDVRGTLVLGFDERRLQQLLR
jgi:glutaredoxin